MVHFWAEMVLRAILATLASIGKDPADVRFSVIVLLIITILIFVRDGYENGWRGMKHRLRRLIPDNEFYGSDCTSGLFSPAKKRLQVKLR